MSKERHTDDIARTMAAAVPEAHTHGAQPVDERPMPIFAGEEAAGYRTQWDAIQTGFVDEPRRAVEEADALVALTIKRLSEIFADERTGLEHQWAGGNEISTEDLRVALRSIVPSSSVCCRCNALYSPLDAVIDVRRVRRDRDPRPAWRRRGGRRVVEGIQELKARDGWRSRRAGRLPLSPASSPRSPAVAATPI